MPEKKSSKKGPAPEEAEQDEAQEMGFETEEEAVAAMVNEVGQFVAPYVRGEAVGAVVVTAVSADGSFSRSYPMMANPDDAEDDADRARIERRNAAAELQALMALRTLQKQLQNKILSRIE